MLMKQVTNPTQQEMIKEIYEEMADKTLSIGCKCISKSHWEVLISLLFNLGSYNILSYNIWDKLPSGEPIYFEYQWMSWNTDIDDIIEIIWHPLRIGDVLDWMQKTDCWVAPQIWDWKTMKEKAELIILDKRIEKKEYMPLEWWKYWDGIIDYLYSFVN